MVDACQHSLANAAGITVKDHGSLENRLDDVAERVMDDAIPKGQGGDQALFRLMDGKIFVDPGLVGFPNQVILDIDQVFFQVSGKLQYFPFIALGLSGF